MKQRIQCELKTTKAKRKHTLRQTQKKFTNIFSVCVFSVVYLKKIYFSCFNDVSSILCSLLASANVYDVLCETFIVCGSFPRKPKLEFIAIDPIADCSRQRQKTRTKVFFLYSHRRHWFYRLHRNPIESIERALQVFCFRSTFVCVRCKIKLA